jgi:signal transduction histidine kinase
MILDGSPDATVAVDDDGRVLLANAAARELPGVDVDLLFAGRTPQATQVAAFREQLRATGRATAEIALAGPRAGQRRIGLEGRQHGPGFVVVLRDVTAQRRVEDELRHLRRLEDLGYLTASVVHDFNNLLTAILCSASLLEREVSTQESAVTLASDIRLAAERAAGLTRRVLSFLRRDAAKPQRLNLNTAMAEMRSLLQMVMGRHVEVVFEFDPNLADVVVDREQLDHVLVNLAVNARDAMSGGGTVTISTATVPVGDSQAGDASSAPATSYVALKVRDTGEGMPPEIRERAFERFFTSKDPGKGTGLGLATAHRFAKQSGGCISLHTAPGRGTTVVLYLPAAPAITRAPAAPRAAGDEDGGSQTIAVIEPDDAVRGALRAILSDRGYRVIDAPSGELALRQSEHARSPVALVLAEVASPGLHAGAVVEHLRAAGHPARLLWMSGETDRRIAERGPLDAPLLRKAFTPGELARRVREVIAGDTSSPAP